MEAAIRETRERSIPHWKETEFLDPSIFDRDPRVFYRGS